MKKRDVTQATAKSEKNRHRASSRNEDTPLRPELSFSGLLFTQS